MRIAVCETVTVFNTGAANKAVIMDLSGVNPGRSMLKAMRQQAHQKCSAKSFFKVQETTKERVASKAKVERGRVILFRGFWP